jgi:hypothetical protein
MCISRDVLIKRDRARFGLALALVVILGTGVAYGQKGSGGGGGGGNSTTAGGGGGQTGPSGSAPGGNSSAATPSSRIEASMLAYEASDRIAAHIADQVRGHKIYIYDSQTFTSIQAYEAYATTVSAFEMSFELFGSEGTKPQSSFVTTAPVVQSLLTSLRSTAEYAGETVNLQSDPVIAQVAHHLGGDNVIIPKFLLGPADDLQASSVVTLRATISSSAGTIVATPPCADITRNVPDQLGCLLLVRNEADVKAQASAQDSQKAAFADLDKLFQVFFGTLMGTSVNLKSSTGTPGGGAPGGGGDQTSPGPSGTNPTGNQSVSVPLLSQIIQGHRLKAQFSKDPNSRILVLEPTEAGGGSRIKHIFLVEIFWTTPTPTFTGGSIVTYLLINPTTSLVEKSEVLRFTVDYGKFHGHKIKTPSNF